MPRASVNASFARKELNTYLPLYTTIEDALDGSVAVKAKRAKYLPIPNAADTSLGNKARYDAYLTRAVFYAVTRRVLAGFVGEIFDRDPVITVPPAMQEFVDDATGEGVGLVQVAKQCVRAALAFGRIGLYVDYPNTNGATTKKELGEGVRPIVSTYSAKQIINWRTRKVNAKTMLCLIVLEEEFDTSDNGFEAKKGKQWRVLRLDAANKYTVEFYRENTGSQMVDALGNVIDFPIMPTDADGKPFEEIPFKFIGSETNTAEIDYPPLFDMADMNMAHYRNSADYEESVFLVGQPTPVVTGLSETWADKYFAEGIGLGSRAAIPLPVGASADLLQAKESSMGKEAMEMKERQMVALGARLAQQQKVERTATEAGLESASEKSTLSNISDNVSVAIEWALYFAARFQGITADGEGKTVFRLNKEFSISFGSPEARQEAIDAWVSEAISYTEMRLALRNGGLARLPDLQAKAEIKKDREAGEGPVNPMSLLKTESELDANGDPVDKNTPASATE